MDLAHVRELPRVLPDLFAQAARRAREAGFDGVELHYAHAYTMASFLSRLNDRADGYGGAREHRVRLPLEVFRPGARGRGRRLHVGCRFLADECVAGGSDVEDTAFFGVAFARAGMDFLSLSRGGKFDDAKQPEVGWAAYPYTGPSGYECMPTVRVGRARPVRPQRRPLRGDPRRGPRGGLRHSGRRHRRHPRVRPGRALLADGKADVVGLARQSLADPDWFRKVRLGRGAEVRLCEYTNYCEALDQKHQQVTCQLWDREALDEPGVARSKDGKRRLVPPAWTPGP